MCKTALPALEEAKEPLWRVAMSCSVSNCLKIMETFPKSITGHWFRFKWDFELQSKGGSLLLNQCWVKLIKVIVKLRKRTTGKLPQTLGNYNWTDTQLCSLFFFFLGGKGNMMASQRNCPPLSQKEGLVLSCWTMTSNKFKASFSKTSSQAAS